ncbi:Gfo/Idh/MocA family oxidoreductase [Marinobacter sp. F3R11]|uniref:Gfo/Idh/MocA family oxidoreductase n=1 Tax=Marinobacter sp. F3R11 TaxID=2267231 RepID=UPI000DE9FD03|nr:Gfo/Idh/MocA family oxidoreductase [Marinobacter sp. F3R11]RBW49274.1 hypothetical protein DS878_14270 [Marinobacter sp. F3R11]
MDLFSKVSTKPHYESYTWGKHRSIFASVLYWLIFLLRILSPLQWIKLIFRKRQAANNDEKERVDFHAMHSEIYLLVVLCLSLAFYFVPPFIPAMPGIPGAIISGLGVLSYAIAALLLFESVMWLFYYMLLRILIEKHLTIFNEAEYFIALPFVLATQFFLLAGLLDVGVSEVLALALNLDFEGYQTSSSAQLTIGTFGYVYTALIIANIINLIPAIPVGRRPNITIIGAGDVVQHRMLPALLAEKLYLPGQVAIISDRIDQGFQDQLRKDGVAYQVLKSSSSSEEKVQEVIKFIKKRSSYAIVATPTESHFGYVSALAKEGIVYGVEKPLVATAAELRVLGQCQDQLMERGFLFSYYWLEKALPLNYFLTLNPQYHRFLDIKVKSSPDAGPAGPDALAYLRLQLGKLVSVDITFFEGKDPRAWSLTKQTGGLFFETLIHPITLLSHVLDEPMQLERLHAEWFLLDTLPEVFNSTASDLNDYGASYVSLRSQPGAACAINVRTGKYMSVKERSMVIRFENGVIRMNLDTRQCSITCPGAGSLADVAISVRHGTADGETSLKYDVQMTLFDSFVHNQGYWSAQRYDDYPGQIDVLSAMADWLKADTGGSHFYRPIPLSEADYKKLG